MYSSSQLLQSLWMQLVTTAEGNLKLVMILKPEGGIIEADNTVIIIRVPLIKFVKD